VKGMCLADLGQAQPAIESLDTTIAALDPGRLRDRAYYLSYLAKAHVRAGDPERAARVGQEALGLAGQAGSRRTIARVDGVCRELRRWRNVQAVHDFSEALRLVGGP
jgi:tetratricopeptide (TPR) repeat protein